LAQGRRRRLEFCSKALDSTASTQGRTAPITGNAMSSMSSLACTRGPTANGSGSTEYTYPQLNGPATAVSRVKRGCDARRRRPSHETQLRNVSNSTAAQEFSTSPAFEKMNLTVGMTGCLGMMPTAGKASNKAIVSKDPMQSCASIFVDAIIEHALEDFTGSLYHDVDDEYMERVTLQVQSAAKVPIAESDENESSTKILDTCMAQEDLRQLEFTTTLDIKCKILDHSLRAATSEIVADNDSYEDVLSLATDVHDYEDVLSLASDLSLMEDADEEFEAMMYTHKVIERARSALGNGCDTDEDASGLDDFCGRFNNSATQTAHFELKAAAQEDHAVTHTLEGMPAVAADRDVLQVEEVRVNASDITKDAIRDSRAQQALFNLRSTTCEASTQTVHLPLHEMEVECEAPRNENICTNASGFHEYATQDTRMQKDLCDLPPTMSETSDLDDLRLKLRLLLKKKTDDGQLQEAFAKQRAAKATQHVDSFREKVSDSLSNACRTRHLQAAFPEISVPGVQPWEEEEKEEKELEDESMKRNQRAQKDDESFIAAAVVGTSRSVLAVALLAPCTRRVFGRKLCPKSNPPVPNAPFPSDCLPPTPAASAAPPAPTTDWSVLRAACALTHQEQTSACAAGAANTVAGCSPSAVSLSGLVPQKEDRSTSPARQASTRVEQEIGSPSASIGNEQATTTKRKAQRRLIGAVVRHQATALAQPTNPIESERLPSPISSMQTPTTEALSPSACSRRLRQALAHSNTEYVAGLGPRVAQGSAQQYWTKASPLPRSDSVPSMSNDAVSAMAMDLYGSMHSGLHHAPTNESLRELSNCSAAAGNRSVSRATSLGEIRLTKKQALAAPVFLPPLADWRCHSRSSGVLPDPLDRLSSIDAMWGTHAAKKAPKWGDAGSVF